MRLPFLFSLLCLCIYSIKGQHTVSGYVFDAQSKERLIGVNVYIPGTTFGASTNTYGFYSINLPEEQYALHVSFIGYNTIKDSVDLRKQNVSLDFALNTSSEVLTEVEITDSEIQAQRVQMSAVTLSAQDIKKIPAFLGEVDIIRAIQLLPGVQSGNEGTTGFYVRGGSPDQNLVLLDGVPVYNASHLFGFFSVFNADAIKNVNLIKGGFPPRFGGRLSSVLEIDMKEGNMSEFHGEGSIGLISTKLTLEGPIVKDKTSFIISGRRTYYDLVVKPFLREGLNTGYYFGDINVKVNHIISRKDRLYLSYYGGNDHFFNEETETNPNDEDEESITNAFLKWGNHTGSFRWNHLFSDKLFGNLTTTFTQYKFNIGFEDIYRNQNPTIEDINGFRYQSLIRDYGARYDLEYSLNTKHKLGGGFNYTYHIFEPGAAQFSNTDFSLDSIINLSNIIYSNDFYTYIQDDWTITDKLRANYGLHYSYYFTKDASYQSLQPRISLRYLLKPDWSLKASYAEMTQYIHLLSNSGIGLPTDLWVSSTAKVKPQFSKQWALGTTKNIMGDAFEISAEVYYKTMQNLIEYKEGASFITPTDWQETVETDGQGEAYGMELLLRKNEGKTTGWIGYTLAWSTRQFSNLNEGITFPYRYDRRHDISIVGSHAFNKKWDVGFTWVFGSGNTFTAPVATYLIVDPNGLFQTVDRYSDRNALRLPPYHRLDLSVSLHTNPRWGHGTWNLSVYNVYNRKNPFFLLIDDNPSTGQKQVNQVSLFPIIPAISYIFKF